MKSVNLEVCKLHAFRIPGARFGKRAKAHRAVCSGGISRAGRAERRFLTQSMRAKGRDS
jgi:hypothetical protein